MADISKIKLPSGSEYDLKDSWARTQIEAITGGSAIVFKGVSSTALTDGGTEKPTVGGQVVQSVDTGDLYFYGTDEFIWNGSVWSELGPSLTILGDLAYADTASTDYTPGGSVSLTNSNVTATVSAAESGDATYTPAGSISASFTGSSTTSTGKFTPTGSVSLSNSNVTATVSAASSGDATYTPAGSISASFTGSATTSTGKFTPSGSVSLSNSNVTATVSAAGSGDATYTPAGTISVATNGAGATTTIHNPTKATVATAVTVAAPGATAPSNSLTYYAVANEVLSLYQIGYNTGDSISTSDVSVKTGDASYSFSGTGARLVTGNISVPSSASFSGAEGDVSVSGTPSGSVSGSFTGTGARLVTGNISVPSSASFSGTEGDVSVSGTPSGSVSGSFTGTGARLVTGNISVPSSASFSGTQATITVTPDTGT